MEQQEMQNDCQALPPSTENRKRSIARATDTHTHTHIQPVNKLADVYLVELNPKP